MNKIIIADDDFIVRTYLKQMLDWKKYGFLLYDAKNGKEALDICLKEQIQVVITDMSMPVMNGMELIKALKQHDLPCHIIVLSCHDDFIYVKEAMKLGAEDYLLKNDLTPEGLLEILQKIDLQKNNSSKNTKADISTEELAQIGLHKLRNDFFQSFNDTATYNEDILNKQAQKADIKSTFAISSAILIKLTDWQQRLELLDDTSITTFKQAFKEMCQNICQNNEYNLKITSYIFQPIEDRPYWGILLDFADENSRSKIEKNLNIIAQKINTFSLRYFNLNAICAISDIQSNLLNLKQHWLNLKQIDNISFYKNDTIFTEIDFSTLTTAIDKNTLDMMQHLAQELNTSTDNLETIIQDFLMQIAQKQFNLKCLNDILNKLQSTLHIDLKIQLNDFTTFKAQFTKQILEQKENLNKDDISHPAIRLAIKYINEHYRQPLSQQIIADFVHLNPAYFSTLFKKSTGINFSDYLINCRLNAVKKRLVNSSDKIKNIAIEEGFTDYQYFCKLFKKIVGLNPSEYRIKD